MGESHTQMQPLLSDYDPGSAYVEAVFSLFATIRLNWESQQRSLALLLTSPSHPEEQATVAANLAIASAQSGLPTVLIEAHVRHPGLGQRFGLSQGPGLSDILLQEETVTPQQVSRYLAPTFVPHLWLLSSGTGGMPHGLAPYAARLPELLRSLRRFLEEGQGQSGLLVVHGAPVLEGADASLLGAYVDQTFLVVVLGRSTRTATKKASEQLQRARARLSGVILTQG
ncbi:CpsD/CapB family tyrosine-protein kinase [Thermogemmatispora tikiterensis]|nr:CpsD/CapB family tyrosine-protein kinase [Thermogemmatispora tikiterensis]